MKIGRVIGKGNNQQRFEVKKLLSDKSVFPSLTYHLQSAQFITNAKGEQYEHIEYTPYEELWTYKSKTAMLFLTTYNNFLAKQPTGLIEETAPGIDKLPFRFTGKELDEETGLYYYGARYLDPKYSRWLSGDPALGEYIPKAPIDEEAKKHNENLPGMGGVFNVVNLHVYHYAGNNPIKYVDPDGRTAKYSIDEESTTVTIQVDIVIYGNDATDALAKEYQTGIEAAWGQDSNGNQWQTEINGKQYFVKFDVNVSVGKRPGFFTKLWNAFFGTKNYIKADRNMHRSNVVNGFLGTWRTEGRRTSLSNDNPAAHEFGHLIGFQDRYSDVSGTHLGWEGNIMGEAAMRGCVEQRNIDALGGYISNKGRLRGTIRLRRMKL